MEYLFGLAWVIGTLAIAFGVYLGCHGLGAVCTSKSTDEALLGGLYWIASGAFIITPLIFFLDAYKL